MVTNFTLYGIKYSYLILMIFKQIYLDKILTETTTVGQSRPGSNGNEGVKHIPQISRPRPLTFDAVYYHFQDTWFLREFYFSTRDTVDFVYKGNFLLARLPHIGEELQLLCYSSISIREEWIYAFSNNINIK